MTSDSYCAHHLLLTPKVPLLNEVWKEVLQLVIVDFPLKYLRKTNLMAGIKFLERNPSAPRPIHHLRETYIKIAMLLKPFTQIIKKRKSKQMSPHLARI